MAAVAAGTLALAAGTALALGAAVLVLGPLWAEDADVPLPPPPPDPSRLALGPAAAAAEGVSAVEALREIEFDRATGKLSDTDYAALKAEYTREALAELRAQDAGVTIAPPKSPAGAPAGLPLTAAAVDAALHVTPGSCFVCGPRPEDDATFCSNCGRFLAAECPVCHAPCTREGQRYCEACGTSLAPNDSPAAVSAATQPR